MNFTGKREVDDRKVSMVVIETVISRPFMIKSIKYTEIRYSKSLHSLTS